MNIIPTVKQNIYTEKSPDEVVNILRSVTLPPDKYNLAEDDSTYEGEVRGGGFVIRRGTHFSQEYLSIGSGPTIYGHLYEPSRETIIGLEIQPRLYSLAFTVFFVATVVVMACLLLSVAIKNSDLVYSLFSLIMLGIACFVAWAAYSINRERGNREVERLNELLDAEMYSGEIE